MRLRDNMLDVYRVLINSEKLLRLLYYKAKDIDDDVLAETPERPNILTMNPQKRWEITRDRIVYTSKIDGLDGQEKCRILIFPERRQGRRNDKTAQQTIVVDILIHQSFQEDLRLEYLADTVSELIQDERITGFGRIDIFDGEPIRYQELANNYLGYRLKFQYGSVKK